MQPSRPKGGLFIGGNMSKKSLRYTKEFKRAALKELDSGQSFAEVSRKTGVPVATLHRWNRDPRNFRAKLLHSFFPQPGKYIRTFTTVPHRAVGQKQNINTDSSPQVQ